MASTREVISLQFGHYSNFVGAHFWNIQESLFSFDPEDSKKTEIYHDCLFRVGRTQQGQETYTPRLLAFDLKGSLRNLTTEGTLYSTPSRSVEWEGELSVHRSNAEPKNEFQMDIDEQELSSDDNALSIASESARTKWYNLDDNVQVWSDFLGTQYHPKSVNIIKEYSHQADHFAFDMFGYGQSLYKNEDFQEEFENNLHFFVEECDHLQGFQVMVDIYDGFGGLSAQVIQDLADEYSSKSVVTFGVLPGTFPGNSDVKSAQRLLNMALCYKHISEDSSMFTPLSLARQAWFNSGIPAVIPHLNYKINLPYHTSAILASTIDALTTPYRLDTVLRSSMSDISNALTFGGRKITCASCSFPLPVGTNNSLQNVVNSTLNRTEKHILTPLMPNNSQVNQFISQVSVLRCDENMMIKKSSEQLSQPMKKPKSLIDSCQSSLEVLNMFSQADNPLAVNTNWVVNQSSPVTPPYPNFFGHSVTKNGFVEEGYHRDDKMIVQHVNVLANMGTCQGVGEMIKSLVKWSRHVDIKKHSCFIESGVEYEDFMDILESLETLSDNYSSH